MALVPKHIRNLSPYIPGMTIDEVKRKYGLTKIIKLASNENPLGPSPKGLAAIKNSFKRLHRYPDATGYELRKKLAESFSVKMDNVILGASPRATVHMVSACKAAAALDGRNYVTPDDVKEMSFHILNHRLILNTETLLSNTEVNYSSNYDVIKNVISETVSNVTPPR